MLASMARPLRVEYPGAYYVMNRGLSRRNIFLEDKDRERFLELLGETSRQWKVEIFAYYLWDNHYHILLQTRGRDFRVT
jgi:putative transposase